jgi:hypothetical protein
MPVKLTCAALALATCLLGVGCTSAAKPSQAASSAPLTGLQINFVLHSYVATLNGTQGTAMGTPPVATVHMSLVYNTASGSVVRLYSQMTGKSFDLVEFWKNPMRQRTLVQLTTCSQTSSPLPSPPSLDDVLLDTIGPLDPGTAKSGFRKSGDAFLRPDGMFYYKLIIPPDKKRTYLYVDSSTSAVVSRADQIKTAELSPSQVPTGITSQCASPAG